MRYAYTDDEKAHLHTLDGKPLIGTSTVVKILGIPLAWWASGKALEQLGWTNPKLVKREDGIKIAGKARKNFFISNEEYYDWLQECYRNHDTAKKEAGTKGVDRHALLEEYVKLMLRGADIGEKEPRYESIQDFIGWSRVNVKRFLWSELHCYSEALWVGGIADVGWLSMDDKVVAADFKSSKAAYFAHFVQIAGYDLEISENGGYTATGEKIFDLPKPIEAYCVIPFGAEKFEPAFRYNVLEYRDNFKAALTLYKSDNNF